MIEKGIQTLFALGFKDTIDIIGDYNRGCKIYYYNMSRSEYVIFTIFNENKTKDLQGFDSWISIYKDSSQIGVIPAINRKTLKFNFDFADDLSLLRQYIPILKSPPKYSTSGLSLRSIKKKFK